MEIKITERALRDIKKFDKNKQVRVIQAIKSFENLSETNFNKSVKKLIGNINGYSIRVDKKIRIFISYKENDNDTLLVFRIVEVKNRRQIEEVYRNMASYLLNN